MDRQSQNPIATNKKMKNELINVTAWEILGVDFIGYFGLKEKIHANELLKRRHCNRAQQ